MFFIITKDDCKSCAKAINFMEANGQMFKEINCSRSYLNDDQVKLLYNISGKNLTNFIREKSEYLESQNISIDNLSENQIREMIKLNFKNIGSFPVIIQLDYLGNAKNCLVGFNDVLLDSWIKDDFIENIFTNVNELYGSDDHCCWLDKKDELINNFKKNILNKKTHSIFNNKKDVLELNGMSEREKSLEHLKNLKKQNDLLIQDSNIQDDLSKGPSLLEKYKAARQQIIENDKKMKESYDFFSMTAKNQTFMDQFEKEKHDLVTPVSSNEKNIENKIHSKSPSNDINSNEIATNDISYGAENISPIQDNIIDNNSLENHKDVELENNELVNSVDGEINDNEFSHSDKMPTLSDLDKESNDSHNLEDNLNQVNVHDLDSTSTEIENNDNTNSLDNISLDDKLNDQHTEHDMEYVNDSDSSNKNDEHDNTYVDKNGNETSNEDQDGYEIFDTSSYTKELDTHTFFDGQTLIDLYNSSNHIDNELRQDNKQDINNDSSSDEIVQLEQDNNQDISDNGLLNIEQEDNEQEAIIATSALSENIEQPEQNDVEEIHENINDDESSNEEQEDNEQDIIIVSDSSKKAEELEQYINQDIKDELSKLDQDNVHDIIIASDSSENIDQLEQTNNQDSNEEQNDEPVLSNEELNASDSKENSDEILLENNNANDEKIDDDEFIDVNFGEYDSIIEQSTKQNDESTLLNTVKNEEGSENLEKQNHTYDNNDEDDNFIDVSFGDYNDDGDHLDDHNNSKNSSTSILNGSNKKVDTQLDFDSDWVDKYRLTESELEYQRGIENEK